MHLLRAVGFIRTAGATGKRGVDGHFLAGGTAGQHLEHYGEIGGGGHDALHTHEDDMDAGQGRDHAPVAFVGDDAGCARLGYGEVTAADAHIGP